MARQRGRVSLLALGALAWPVAELLAWQRARKIVAVVVTLAIGSELAATMQLVPSWHDSLALWQRATEVQPRAVYGYLRLGETYRAQKRFREAAASYVRAARFDGRSPVGNLQTAEVE